MYSVSSLETTNFLQNVQFFRRTFVSRMSKVRNKTKTVKTFKISVLNYPYLAYVVLFKQQLTTSFSVLWLCYQINCVKNYLMKSNLLQFRQQKQVHIAVIVVLNLQFFNYRGLNFDDLIDFRLPKVQKFIKF